MRIAKDGDYVHKKRLQGIANLCEPTFSLGMENFEENGEWCSTKIPYRRRWFPQVLKCHEMFNAGIKIA